MDTELLRPFERVVAALKTCGSQVRYVSADQVRATCPAHSDRRASLGVSWVDDKVLLHCFAGCRVSSILEKLGLRPTDLFSGPRTASRRPKIVATYNYLDHDGRLIAQKQRREPKSFTWRRPDPHKAGGWIYDLKGVTVGLYRLPDLIGARRVFVVEGEKSVDLLGTMGLAAVCSHAGAGKWRPTLSMDLWLSGCREAIILPDNDQPGRAHAEAVADTMNAIDVDEPIVVKVAALAGIACGADVFDWLQAGHSSDDLLNVVTSAPVWAPGAAERNRAARRAEQAKHRMRNWRKRQKGTDVPGISATVVDRIGCALDAVVDALKGAEPLTYRAIWKALKNRSHSRRAILDALYRGTQTGLLVVDIGGGRGRRNLYLRSGIHGVTQPGQFSEGVPAPPASDARTLGNSSQATRASQRPVTLFAVTQGERSFLTLEKNLLQEISQNILGVTEMRDTHSIGGHRTGSDPLGLVSEEQELAIACGHCCGKNGAELRCQLCRHSPTYWRSRSASTGAREQRRA